SAQQHSDINKNQANHHLTTIEIPSDEDPANVELLPQLINDCVGKTNIVSAQLTRDLRQVLAGIIEVVLDSTGIGHNRVAASQRIKGEISKTSDHIRRLQRTVKDQQQILRAVSGVLWRDKNVAAFGVLKCNPALFHEIKA